MPIHKRESDVNNRLYVKSEKESVSIESISPKKPYEVIATSATGGFVFVKDDDGKALKLWTTISSEVLYDKFLYCDVNGNEIKDVDIYSFSRAMLIPNDEESLSYATVD